MDFKVIFLVLSLVIQPTLSIWCYYCAETNCYNQMKIRECPYIYTHCTAAVVDYCKDTSYC